MAALLSGNMEGGLYMYNVCEITFGDIVAAALFNSFSFSFYPAIVERGLVKSLVGNHLSE